MPGARLDDRAVREIGRSGTVDGSTGPVGDGGSP
ncbi:hypothetical protein ABID92_001714 [Frigoribacterium sp. PvP120]|nr:hypothetical protein [Frigoribacterium sp. PvP121]